MNFHEMVQRFAAALPGTDSFKQANADCEAIILDQPFQAGAAFLVAGFCRSYVLIYEDQGLEHDFALRNQRQLLEYMNSLQAALATCDHAIAHQALIEVVTHYARSERIF